MAKDTPTETQLQDPTAPNTAVEPSAVPAGLADPPAASNGFPPPIIQLKNLTKRFGSKVILDKINLDIPEKRITVVMGGSGHGKSTILKLIVGFLTPEEGEVIIDGQNVLNLPRQAKLEVQKKLGMSFQYSALFDSMSVFENVAFPLREHTKLPENEIEDRVYTILERLGLPDVGTKMPSELSGGMKKRVGVARSIMMQPKIMLFDEPESGLDPITTTAIGDLILEMRDDFHMSCVVISHHLENTMRIADKVAMLYKSHFIAQGTPEEMKAHDDPVLQQFLKGEAQGPF